VIMGATTPQLATVRPRMFAPLEPRDEQASVERFELEALPAVQAQLVEERPEPAHDLDEAEVVAFVGPDAPKINAGVAVGGTRAACAAGGLSRNRQIGLYGRPVAPSVLVAVNVDGDFEELTGIVKSRVIVSVDGGAGLEAQADIIFRGDPNELIAALG